MARNARAFRECAGISILAPLFHIFSILRMSTPYHGKCSQIFASRLIWRLTEDENSESLVFNSGQYARIHILQKLF